MGTFLWVPNIYSHVRLPKTNNKYLSKFSWSESSSEQQRHVSCCNFTFITAVKIQRYTHTHTHIHRCICLCDGAHIISVADPGGWGSWPPWPLFFTFCVWKHVPKQDLWPPGPRHRVMTKNFAPWAPHLSPGSVTVYIVFEKTVIMPDIPFYTGSMQRVCSCNINRVIHVLRTFMLHMIAIVLLNPTYPEFNIFPSYSNIYNDALYD